MPEARLLENKGEDRTRWTELLRSLPAELQDLHYTPEYFDIYERTYGTPAVLFVYQAKGATVLQPFLKRSLEGLPGLSSAGLSDLESVYGYGGPLRLPASPAPSEEEALAFRRALLELSTERGFVSEFCMLHPFLLSHQKRLLPGDVELVYRKEIPFVDLQDPLELLWSRIEERQRKGVALARRRGVVIRREAASDQDLREFQEMYLKTMERKGATDQWRFPDTYFPNCRDCLGADAVALFSAMVQGRRAASFFLLHSRQTAYYHFAASDPEFNNVNPTSLLLFDTLLWARSSGYRYYHLGGGRSDDAGDSLFNFKYSFAGRTAPLYVYKRPLQEERFRDLVRQRTEFDQARGLQPQSSTFFPPYRRG